MSETVKRSKLEGLYACLFDLFKNKIYIILFVVGLFLIEALLSMWTGNLYDMNIWFQTGVWMNQGTNIYLPNNHLGYPPLWAFWCLIAYRIYSIMGNNIELWRFVIKLPLILAQFGLAFVIARFAQSRFSKATARKIFLLVLTWIFFIYIGALWGQINMLSALLTFLAFYAVITKKTTLGAVLLGVAVALKIYPLILLPAFVAFILKNQTKKEAGRFALFSVALPVVFTLGVLAVYQWDTIYFLRTIFYWTPVFETANPLQIQGGCMNLWSFISLLNIDVSQVWLIRFIWIPILAATAVYWFKKPQMKDVDLNLAIISFYLLFMVSYGWVTEQSFLDPLPFILLHIVAFQPRKTYMYGLLTIQGLVFVFSTFNWGPFIFTPLLTKVNLPLLQAIQILDPKYPLIWTTRGILGLAVSIAICIFLVGLAKPSLFEKVFKKSLVH